MIGRWAYMCYVVERRGHSSCAIIAQRITCEDEVLQTSVCVNVLGECCGPNRAHSLALQIQPLQSRVTCSQGRYSKEAPAPVHL